MGSRFLSRPLGIFVVLALAVAMVPKVAAGSSPVPVTVNGGWVRGTWTQTYTFTLNEPGVLKVATNWSQVSCWVQATFPVDILNGTNVIGTVDAQPCSPMQLGDDSLGPDYFFGNNSYFSFSFQLEPGTYAIHWNMLPPGNVVASDNGYSPTAWVRVETAPTRPPSIALTVVDPPAMAWAAVQWLDPRNGKWTNVDGWTGPLQQDEWGFMVFAVDEADRGAGVFRWVVYDKDPAKGGKPWAMTHIFNLPTSDWSWFEILKGWNLPK